MTVAIDPLDLEQFRALLRERFGLQLDESERDHLAQVVADRMRETGASGFGAYMSQLVSPAAGRAELRALAEKVTVGETYFFRNQTQLRAFVADALPDRAHAPTSRRELRILSAGCASGEEAHTIAILLRDHLPDAASFRVSIAGIDLNPAAIERAKRGVYSPWSLRQAPESIRTRYFRPVGRDFALDDGIRAMVTFEERNLLHDDPAFWRPDAFDVIFFRNVAIYLAPDATRAVVARFARSLSPGGFLFLGDAETLRNASHEFHLRHAHEAFYYQLRSGAPVRAPAPAWLPEPVESLPVAIVETSTSWVDAIHKASERIASLTRASSLPAASGVPVASRPASERVWNLAPATELVRQERYGEALDSLTALPPEAGSDPDVQLLRAALLTNRGNVAEAERVCGVVLELDELNAGAHYLKALCREHAGDRAAALEHDRTAAYLDPTFAMPHLHLGLLAKRAGDHASARREIGRALELLAGEDASQILLFGGGFNREALALLCQAELRACQPGAA